MIATTAPDTVAVLDQLRAIVDRHDAGDDVTELLDEVGGVLRRARARIRAAVKREQGEPVGKPATPQPSAPVPTPVVPEQRAVPAATRDERVTADVGPHPAAPTADGQRIGPPAPTVRRARKRADIPGSIPVQVRGSTPWRFVPLAVLAVVVALAVVLGATSGGPAAVGTFAVLLLVAVCAPLARLLNRGGTARSVWPPGRT